MKKLLFSIISTLIISTNVFAQDIETKKVISTGVGLTESDALKDTTRNAVQQVVGAYILTDTYVKNSQIIKDQILTNSNGFVKGFKIISQIKEDNGLIKIEAEVEVEPSNVTKRLGELNIALKDVATTEFKAISLDKFQATKDFKNMFDEIVLKPIKENKQIYDIKIGELRSVDKLPSYFSQNRNESLMPFILTFSISLKKDYLDSVRSFLEKTSINKYNGYIPRNFDGYSRSVYFYKINRNFDLEESYIYEFDEKLENTYNSMIDEFKNTEYNHRHLLIIKLNDSNNGLIKSIVLPNHGHYYSHDNCQLALNGNTSYERVLYWNSVYSSYGRLGFINDSKNLELGMYLNEEEVSKIKSASIEIKWNKE